MKNMHVVQGLRKSGWLELGRWFDHDAAEAYALESTKYERGVRIVTKEWLGGNALAVLPISVTPVEVFGAGILEEVG